MLGGRALPVGWSEIQAGASRIADSPFAVSKTPLNLSLYPSSTYGTDRFVRDIRHLNAGLVIDLTMSNRYYSRKRVARDAGVPVRKLRLKGHSVPTRRECRYFAHVVNVFFRRNPHRTVVVHCTHGINRTGFMICFYLCRHLQWDVETAMETFANSRAPIQHPAYRNALIGMFADGRAESIDAAPRQD